MLHFGLSYVGMIYLGMLFIPNIIWTRNKPKDYEKYVVNENKFLQILEKIGEVLVCGTALIFADFNIRLDSIWSVWLLLSFILMLMYEFYWIRYFRSKKEMSDFYSSICGVPVAGATLPVCAFFLLGIYGCNIFLLVGTIILGIGHIGIHLNHRKAISDSMKQQKLIKRILKWSIGSLLIIIIGFGVFIIGCKNVNYLQVASFNNKGVEESIYVPLGGQEQYLLIRGSDVENPVMIWLHGGPAGADGYMNYTIQKYLTDEYTVINWDQRGCGRTYFHNYKSDPENRTASFEQAQIDLDDLVDYARNRFNTDKVIIIGHSYGTMLGSKYVLQNPNKVLAYIGIGQVVSLESDFYSYEDALAKAVAAGDDTGAMEAAYQKCKEELTLVNMLELRAHVRPYHIPEKEDNSIWQGLVSPDMGIDDFRWFVKQATGIDAFIALNATLFDYIMKNDVRDYGLEYQVPVGFITGSDDWVTPVKYMEDYYDLISAPTKQKVLVDGCGHGPQHTSPREFSELLKRMIPNS